MYRCRECSPDYGPEGDSSIVCGSATESQAEGADDDDDDDDEEVFITSPPVEPGADARSTELLLPSRPETPIHEQIIQMPLPQPRVSSSVDDEEEEQVMLELAAGAPLLLDHLMRTPLTCAVM
ncbi:uncharacterized protein LOC105389911 [Plutella xylostella]|uniref:uncharacterized protein LOC105389911 n=1 Tax=Plutella xylostella TaxID=51655 RepID=UPI002032291C|nr:uncharacterized protein LOC105389911 [Plutella xylostella]